MPHDPHTDPDPAAHLDDEQLSAQLDGDAATGEGDGAADAAGHLAQCAACRARLDRLAAAAAAVGAPVARLERATADGLIAAAIARGQAGGRHRSPAPGSGGGGAASSPAPSVVVPIGRGRSPHALRWLAVAAALLAVVAAVPLLLRTTDARDDTALEARTGAGDAPAMLESEPQAGTGRSAGGGVSGPAPVEDRATSEMAGGAAAATTPGPLLAGDIGDHDSLVTVEQAARQDLEGDGGTRRQSNLATPPAPPHCEDAARAHHGEPLGELRWAATLRWSGADAEALVLARPDGSVLYIMSRPDCAALAVTRW